MEITYVNHKNYLLGKGVANGSGESASGVHLTMGGKKIPVKLKHFWGVFQPGKYLFRVPNAGRIPPLVNVVTEVQVIPVLVDALRTFYLLHGQDPSSTGLASVSLVLIT